MESLPVDKLVENYEYVSQRCETLKTIIEELGLSHLIPTIEENKENTEKNKTNWKMKGSISNLKTSIQTYEILNEDLNKHVEVARRELAREEALVKEFSTTDDKIKLLKEKVQLYKTKLEKSKKNSCLKEPQLDFKNISKQIETLKMLEGEKDALEEDLKKFSGLKPDILEAKQQLAGIKSEYDGLVDEINKMKL